MQWNKLMNVVLVRNDYGVCYDFYTEKLGLIPVYGDRNGPTTSFTAKEGNPECLVIHNAAEMSKIKAYTPPAISTAADTILLGIPTDDVDKDYKRLKEAGVQFIGEPQTMEAGWRMAYFRDTEGNLFEIGSPVGE